MKIEKGTLVVILDRLEGETTSVNLFGIVRERDPMEKREWAVDCSPRGSRHYGLPKNLFPLVQLPAIDWKLSPEEALQKHLLEVIATLAGHIHKLQGKGPFKNCDKGR